MKMEEECQDIMNSKNRTSFTDSYPSRPKEAIVSMLSVFSLFGTLGNALVLYVYVRKKNKLPSTIFIICLAATDSMTSCVIMPFTMTMEWLDYFIIYDWLCKVYFFLITCNVPFAMYIMVAIAVDRYLCICRPHCHLLDTRRSQIGIVFLALISALFGVLTALFHGVYVTESFDVTFNDTDRVESLRNTILKDLNFDFADKCGNDSNPICEEASLNTTNALADSLTVAWITKCQMSGKKAVVYAGQCRFNEVIFSTFFRKTYQKVYASMFLICFIIVFLLYISIYRSVLVRRTKRLRARQKTNLRLLRDVSVTDTHTTTAETPLHNGFEMLEMSGEKRRALLESDNSMREKYLLANIRTALMLFVVTLVFILAFLPSWLMAHGVVRFHAVIFYCYFAYNVSNPIIYAFMNPTFRNELQKMFCCRNISSKNSFSK